MQSVGIVCEYNPFHNGHEYQFRKIRNSLGDDTAIICVMSGNFVQRAEPAAFRKHARAKAAALCGADLVLELPVPTAVSSAEGFASGAVSLLNDLRVCDYISFGAECPDIRKLTDVAGLLADGKTDEILKEEMQSGISYAAAREKAVLRLMPEASGILRMPNNILAVEYLKALRQSGSAIRPLPIERKDGAHDDPDGVSSGAARLAMKRGEMPAFLPEKACEVFSEEIKAGRGPVDIHSLEQSILYRLRIMSEENFAQLPGARAEGLYMRLYHAAQDSVNYDDFLAKAAAKRYSVSRIRRSALCALLGLTETDLTQKPGYIRVLAMSGRGFVLLREIKKASPLPIINKPARGENALFVRDARLSDIYTLAYPRAEQRTCGSDYSMSPFIAE